MGTLLELYASSWVGVFSGRLSVSHLGPVACSRPFRPRVSKPFLHVALWPQAVSVVYLFLDKYKIYIYILKDFIYLFLERGEGTEKEKDINMWLPLTHPHQGPGLQPRHVVTQGPHATVTVVSCLIVDCACVCVCVCCCFWFQPQ